MIYVRCRKQSMIFISNHFTNTFLTTSFEHLTFSTTNFIFPEKKYKEQTFKNLMSELTRFLEDFLVQQEFAKRKKEKDYFLLDALYQKSADKFFSQKIESLQAEKTIFQNADFYEHQYTVDKFAYGFQVARKSRLAHTNLQKLIKNLDCFYLAEKLKYYCVILNRKSIVSDKIDVFLPKEILQYIEKGDFEDIPAVILYYRLLLLLISEKEKEEKHYWAQNQSTTNYLIHLNFLSHHYL